MADTTLMTSVPRWLYDSTPLDPTEHRSFLTRMYAAILATGGCVCDCQSHHRVHWRFTCGMLHFQFSGLGEVPGFLNGAAGSLFPVQQLKPVAFRQEEDGSVSMAISKKGGGKKKGKSSSSRRRLALMNLGGLMLPSFLESFGKVLAHSFDSQIKRMDGCQDWQLDRMEKPQFFVISSPELHVGQFAHLRFTFPKEPHEEVRALRTRVWGEIVLSMLLLTISKFPSDLIEKNVEMCGCRAVAKGMIEAKQQQSQGAKGGEEAAAPVTAPTPRPVSPVVVEPIRNSELALFLLSQATAAPPVSDGAECGD
jgi:hypothetical protein